MKSATGASKGRTKGILRRKMRRWLSLIGYIACSIGILMALYYLALQLTLPEIYL